MTATLNPAFQRFLAALGDELVLAQVLVRRHGSAFELRHVSDRNTPEGDLTGVTVPGLRDLAQFTAAGAFRPIKAAPNLRAGWRTTAADERNLEAALHHLYPGAVADWFAAQASPPPVTHYREFSARQTGMYRVTALLRDDDTSAITRVCCDPMFCLKRRVWTLPGLAPDESAGKSLIPCLEPCAVFLEFARKAARIQQEDRLDVKLSPSELETIMAALECEGPSGTGGIREADFNEAANPRRARLVRERLMTLRLK